MARGANLAAGTALWHRHDSVSVLPHAAITRPRRCVVEGAESDTGKAQESGYAHCIRSRFVRVRGRGELYAAYAMTDIGHIEAIFRYPVKSMAGEQLQAAALGWHGVEGDRRLASRRTGDKSGFPWLSATKLPDLLLYAPQYGEGTGDGALPTHVRTPDADEVPVFGEALAADVGRRHGAPVQMMHLRHGVFDDASISVITLDTV